jgi:hypothetical protein
LFEGKENFMKDAYLGYKVSLAQKSSLWLPPTSTGEFVHKTKMLNPFMISIFGLAKGLE